MRHMIDFNYQFGEGFIESMYVHWEVIIISHHIDCMEALGMESYAITDSQIGASSEYNGIYPAVRGRLHLKTVPGWRGDAWAAHPGDSTPWLQIDLIKQRIKTVRVATQGRHDSPQWVTKYSLSYSNDTSNFLFYKEQGKSANKVSVT